MCGYVVPTGNYSVICFTGGGARRDPRRVATELGEHGNTLTLCAVGLLHEDMMGVWIGCLIIASRHHRSEIEHDGNL